MRRFLALWRARPVLASAFVMACAVTLFFAGRFAVYSVYWATHREVPVEPWMTVGYVARSWGLEPQALGSEAGLPMPQVRGHPQTLEEIARDRGEPVAEVIARVETALTRLREARPAE
ncbi:hypothetical protein [Tabrizicola thermarum]|uniref:hypothetical protein n=1 Tax=Tabrizicola thermarum TaxID=2670345 RepID=UPI000FFC1F05|nr:hypothetical protein [Tabrizicola thermarum]